MNLHVLESSTKACICCMLSEIPERDMRQILLHDYPWHETALLMLKMQSWSCFAQGLLNWDIYTNLSEVQNSEVPFTIIWLIIERTCVCSVRAQNNYALRKQLCAPLTRTLGYPKSTQCNFNSCNVRLIVDWIISTVRAGWPCVGGDYTLTYYRALPGRRCVRSFRYCGMMDRVIFIFLCWQVVPVTAPIKL